MLKLGHADAAQPATRTPELSNSPTCTSKQHTTQKSIHRGACSFSGAFFWILKAHGTSTLSMNEEEERNTSKWAWMENTNMGRHSVSLCVTLYTQTQGAHHTLDKKEQDISLLAINEFSICTSHYHYQDLSIKRAPKAVSWLTETPHAWRFRCWTIHSIKFNHFFLFF